MLRFADVGLPFALFEAPISAADPADVVETGTCAVCTDRARYLFAGACYGCFRAGRVDHSIDTELGVVGRAQAEAGTIDGVPLDDPRELAGYDLVPQPVDRAFPRERTYAVRIPVAELRELVTTPRYATRRGTRWLFHCGRPCVFLGAVTVDLLAQLAGSSAREPMATALAALVGVPATDGADLLDALAADALGVHAFRCRTCAGLRAHRDGDG
jgi:uncharacterized protein CbrC (UPF0167 family)